MRKMFALCFPVVLFTCSIARFSSSAADSTNDPKAVLKQQAQAYATAYMKRDYQTCYGMMNGAMIQAVGGKINALNNLQNTEKELKRHGVMLQDISVGAPREIITHKNVLYAVVPEKQSYTIKDNQLILDSYFLATSSDNGTTWSLMEGSARLADHLRINALLLFSRLKLPTRVLYLAENKNFRMIEKGGAFITDPVTREYIKSLRKR